MDNITVIKATLASCAKMGLVIPASCCTEILDVIEGLEEDVKNLKEIVARKEEGRPTTCDELTAAMKRYAQEKGTKPEAIIANVAAWDALEEDVSKYTVNKPDEKYATFEGRRVYKVEDGCKMRVIRLVRDVVVINLDKQERGANV